MYLTQNIILMDNDYGSNIEKKIIKEGVNFHCTGNPLSVLETVSTIDVDYIIVSDNFDNLDVLGFNRTLNSIIEKEPIPMFIYTEKKDEFYKKIVSKNGYLGVVNKPLTHEQLFLSISLFNKSEGDNFEQNTHKTEHEHYKEYFKLQQPLPNIKDVPSFDYLLVKSAIEIFKRDHSVTPTLESIATELNTNESRLSESFLKIYQSTIFAWLREERLLISKKLILNGVGNITQIAYSLGYADVSHFSRSFKSRFGCSPKKMYKRERLII